MEVHEPPVAWTPSDDVVAQSNVAALMRAQGKATYRELHRWSVDDPSAFWAAVIADLAIEFDRPPDAVLGSDDPAAPDWLPGASFNIVDSALGGDPERAAIRSNSSTGITTMSVSELTHSVARFANGFRDAGYSPGDRVAIAMPMTTEAVIAYLGTVAAGGVVVSIADSFAPEEIAVRLDLTKPVAVVTQDEMQRAGRVLPMHAKCAEASTIPCIVVPATGAKIREQDVDWETFLSDDTTLDTVSQPAGAHTNILFSSGTTGEPKAIPWTQTTPLKAAMDGRYHHDIHAGEVVAWPTNLGWMMGPWLIYAALLNNATIALFGDAPTTRAFVEFVDKAGVTMLGIVPSIVAAWRANGSLVEGDWSTVRVLSSTGEASNPDDYAWLMKVAGGVPVIEYCGGTEIGGGYLSGTVLDPAVPSRFTTPTLGLDLVLIDDEGQASNTGEVFLIGPSIGLSTELLNRDHWSVYFSGVPDDARQLRRHGDQMHRDSNGRYRALGRVDDTMNLGGIKVSSAELEEVLGLAPGVADVAAVAVSPPDGGPDRLVVFVVREADASSEDLQVAMQGMIKQHLNPLFRIHDVVAVEALPRTASQKVMRRVLRTEYA